MKIFSPHILWPAVGVTLLAVAAVLFRPLLPIDETRYMTVAWEMRLHDGWIAPLTLNFEPYHHKPPLLFWMINAFWSVFGINRWAALIPMALSSLAVVLLTIKLGRKILPAEHFDAARIAVLAIGSVPFLIYGTLVMFDLTLTVFVLAALLCLLNYADTRQFRYIFLMGLFTGMGVLTKGPVAYLYIIFPILLAPLWKPDFTKGISWYGDCAAGLFISIFPVGFWLLPVLAQSDNQFAFWLLWEQTAGRVTGNFNDAHVRPLYFYLPLLPVLFAPWIFFPSFWRAARTLDKQNMAIRFLACWAVPVFVCFSFISGKQPHYLLPLLPAVLLFLSVMLEKTSVHTLRTVTIAMVCVVIAGQGIASFTFFRGYDLKPVAAYLLEHPDHPWAFVRNYHGEVGFLARVTQPVADITLDQADQWFRDNPHGMAIIRYKHTGEVQRYQELYSQHYRGKMLGVFTVRAITPPSP